MGGASCAGDCRGSGGWRCGGVGRMCQRLDQVAEQPAYLAWACKQRRACSVSGVISRRGLRIARMNHRTERLLNRKQIDPGSRQLNRSPGQRMLCCALHAFAAPQRRGRRAPARYNLDTTATSTGNNPADACCDCVCVSTPRCCRTLRTMPATLSLCRVFTQKAWVRSSSQYSSTPATSASISS